MGPSPTRIHQKLSRPKYGIIVCMQRARWRRPLHCSGGQCSDSTLPSDSEMGLRRSGETPNERGVVGLRSMATLVDGNGSQRREIKNIDLYLLAVAFELLGSLYFVDRFLRIRSEAHSLVPVHFSIFTFHFFSISFLCLMNVISLFISVFSFHFILL